MAVRIRLRRMGAKKHPSYRIVVADARSPRDGAFIETIGQYNPLTDPETVKIDEQKARLWLQRGAQPSQPVARLLSKVGLGPAAASSAMTPSAESDQDETEESESESEGEA